MNERRFFFREFSGSVLDRARQTLQGRKRLEQQVAEILEEITGNQDELAEFDRGFFDSYEMSYSMTLAYPREFFEQMAEQADIAHQGVETLDLVKSLHKRGII